MQGSGPCFTHESSRFARKRGSLMGEVAARNRRCVDTDEPRRNEFEAKSSVLVGFAGALVCQRLISGGQKWPEASSSENCPRQRGKERLMAQFGIMNSRPLSVHSWAETPSHYCPTDSDQYTDVSGEDALRRNPEADSCSSHV